MRVVIAEDFALLREGLARLLAEDGHEVVAAVADAEDLLRHGARPMQPDIVVTDVRMPPTHTDEGLRAALVDPRVVARDRRARALPVRRGALRLGAPGRRRRAASATCSRTASPTSSEFLDGRTPRRGGRHRARPRGRRPAARAIPTPGPARRASPAASARCCG